MERPSIGNPPTPGIGSGKPWNLIASTQSIQEAEVIAQHYESMGFETRIDRKSRAGLALYEVWAAKEPDERTARSIR